MILRNCRFAAALTEGTDLSQGDVLLKDGKIAAIAPCGSLADTGEQELDLNGKYLLPGLIDMHVHLFMVDGNTERFGSYTPAEHTLHCLEYAQTLLDLGYTTVRDVGDNPSWPTVPLSKAFAEGRFLGPNLIPSGPILCPTAPGTANFILENIDGIDSVRHMARLSLRKGAKFIKMYGSGSMMAQNAEPGFPIIEPDEIREAVKIAKRYGTYVAIHCHGAEAIDNAVHAGVRTVEHASFITEETLRYMDGIKNDIGIVPTLSVTYGLAEPQRTDPIAVRVRKLLETICESLKNAYAHNVRMGWGTDIRMTEYRAHPEREFWLRKELLGFRDEDIIRQATIDSAKLMKMDNLIGSVKTGKQADLIVVEGDPSQDISVMYQKPLHVIKSGKLVR